MQRVKEQRFDAAKDPLDLRDLMYEGSLIELPKWIDNRGKVPFMLDQGLEGACTGFGLAAVVNFLLHNQRGAEWLTPDRGASARMLYEMAKRYDEWEGANYDGSSIRGAMKGWYKHGVCREAVWPYQVSDKKERLTADRQIDALDRPLGNYFRVRHLHLPQVHSALAEVGVVYASADVHDGWDMVDPSTGLIPFRKDNAGGHAFAVVGYTQKGFLIQNSWGQDWGINGFALLTYDDWLENAWDCWVARMGVPTASVPQAAAAKFGRATTFHYIPHPAVVFSEIRRHFVNFGNDGRLSETGRYQTVEADVEDILQKGFVSQSENWSHPRKLMLYAHGGLNDEKASASRIASFRPYFLANQIYPLHFMWETGLWDTIKSIVGDAFRRRRFAGIWDDVKDRLKDLADEGIELATRPFGRPVWSQMKENAMLASEDGGGADFLAGRLAQLALEGHEFELHLVGHSAGSILLAFLLPTLEAWGLKTSTITLYAPACTTELFRSNYMPYLDQAMRMTIFNLNEEYEQDDDVVGVYNKSLLYLVAEAFEAKKRTPLLGMQKYLTEDKVIAAALGEPKQRTRSATIYSAGGPSVTLRSTSTNHGGFDNDADTLNSTLRIIRGTNRLVEPFPAM